MKLHLGCGQVYLEGYVNIDYPLSEHTVQQKTVADKFADLTTLTYKSETIDEVRLHHVFEHFPRTTALGLLAAWHSWLKKDGKIHIEVPDFNASARHVLSPLVSQKHRKLAIRHIFGSNEAPWAVHYDGWSKKRFEEIFKVIGFSLDKVQKTSYKGTYNITVIGTKNSKTCSRPVVIQRVRAYLDDFTVDDSDFESRLLDIWMRDFTDQLDKGCSK